MRESLLVCIAFHHDENRLQFLQRVMENFEHYDLDVSAIIDTNRWFEAPRTSTFHQLCIHSNLAHPFHLTWKHREHFRDRIAEFDYFMYVEDDILVPWEAFQNYINNFQVLWPTYVPSFIRIEEHEGQQYVTDITHQQSFHPICAAGVLGPLDFSKISQPYHGFWILPRKELISSMRPDFVKLSDSREHAASYPMWGLGVAPLVQVKLTDDGWRVDKRCWVYHLPNNYARCPESPHAKIKPADIFL